MNKHFATFLDLSLWISALLGLVYHVRFLWFVNYAALHDPSLFDQIFYFVTGLGHEAFAVFFAVNGILAGALLARQPSQQGELVLLRRWLRTHVALLPVLVFGGLLDLVGMHFLNDSGLYTDFPDLTTVTLTWPAFLGNLFMLQPTLVPTFGSNAMLYLYAYLWWSCCLLVLLRCAGHRKGAAGIGLGAALLLLFALAMPPTFWPWLVIWLAGAAVGLRGSRPRPAMHPLAAWALLIAVILFSRLAGGRTDILPAPFGSMLSFWKYALVGMAYAAVAAAVWRRPPSAPLALPAPSLFARLNRHLAGSAGLTLMFHFPVMMLATGIGADLFAHKLMQQPGPLCYLLFALTVALCYTASYVLAPRVNRQASG